MNLGRTAILVLSLFASSVFITTYALDTYAQDLQRVTKFFDTILTQEAEQMDRQITPSLSDEQFLSLALHYRDIFVMRCKDTFYQELTTNQQEIALRLLTALNRLAQTTTQDLMEMTTVHDNAEQFNRYNAAFEQYYRNHCGNVDDCKHLNPRQVAVVLDKIMCMETGNKRYDTVIRFMCNCAYVNDLCELMHYEQERTATVLQLCFAPVIEAIGSTFVLFNDNYYYQGWQEQFVRNGAIFAHMHSVTQPLLTALNA